MNPPDAVCRRNWMLVGSAASLVMALFTGLRPAECVASPRNIINVGTIVFLGYIAAMGCRSWANALLRVPTWPWYIRPGSMALLIASMVFLTAVGSLVIEEVLLATGPRCAPPALVCLLLFVASALFFIPVIDWPAGCGLRLPWGYRAHQGSSSRIPLDVDGEVDPPMTLPGWRGSGTSDSGHSSKRSPGK